MLYGNFQINRPVGTGHSRPNDVRRLRRALNETGHASSPPNPSGQYDASLIASIERFQRDFGLKPDGIVLPGGPTERVLDMALAARREGGADAQALFRDSFKAPADVGFGFQTSGPQDGSRGRFVDGKGEAVPPQRLQEILRNRLETPPVLLAIMRRDPFGRKPGQDILEGGGGYGGPSRGGAPLGPVLREIMRQMFSIGGPKPQREPGTPPPVVPPISDPRPHPEPTPVTPPPLDKPDRPGSVIDDLPNHTEYPDEPPMPPGERPGQSARPDRPVKPVYEWLDEDEFWNEVNILERAGSPETRELNDRTGKRVVALGKKYGCDLKFVGGGFDEENKYRSEFGLKPRGRLKVRRHPNRNRSWLDVMLKDKNSKARILINTADVNAKGALTPREAFQKMKVLINKRAKDVFIALPKPRTKGVNLEDYVKTFEPALLDVLRQIGCIPKEGEEKDADDKAPE